MPKKIDLTDQTFGDWYVIGEGSSGKAGLNWICRCKCGVIKEVGGGSLRRGKSTRCTQCSGKVKSSNSTGKLNVTHGHSSHPLWATWNAMIRRCRPDVGSKRYGKRGIVVCERWQGTDTGFLNFVEDMGPRPEGMTLDRINSDGNYEPDNCRWADDIVQANNKDKRLLKTNRKLTDDDVMEIRRLNKEGNMLKKDIAALFQINQGTLSSVIHYRTFKDVL